MDQATRRVVLGIGNILNHDEGLGIAALKLLEQRLGLPDNLQLLDGGVLGLDLLPVVEECDHLLVLDAIDGSLAPGSLIELPKEQIPLYSGVKMSQHQTTFQEVLALANLRGRLPAHLHMVGVQPADMTLGVGLSPQVEAAMPQVVEHAIAVLQEWGLLA